MTEKTLVYAGFVRDLLLWGWYTGLWGLCGIIVLFAAS